MKTASIVKTTAAVTARQLEKINRYTRRALKEEEIFAFSVILCDNEIDRDGERFPTESLTKLAELFLGSTGVFDHAPRAENQSARIFDTAVEAPGGVTAAGEAYAALRAWAYMVRCGKNNDLILEIDAGIKKEVSVGCAVEKILCSVCGANRREDGCTHQKGEIYEGHACHDLLVGPTDAYEWSFVAVPAQKNAGVTKRYRQMDAGKAHLAKLTRLAALGERYESELRASVVKLGLLAQPELTAGTLQGIAARLCTEELATLRDSFGAAAAKRYPIAPQLGRVPKEEKDDNEFRI